MLEAEGHQGTDDRCAAYADVPEADTLGLFVTLVPVGSGQYSLCHLALLAMLVAEISTYHIEVIKISEGLIHDSNMPSKNLVATRDAYELQAEVQATTAPQQQTIVPRYLAVGNRCLRRVMLVQSDSLGSWASKINVLDRSVNFLSFQYVMQYCLPGSMHGASRMPRKQHKRSATAFHTAQ